MSVLIEPAGLQSLMTTEAVVVIDTRDPDTYAQGHLPGAVNVRDIFTYLATTDPDGIETLKGKFAALFGAAGLSGKETAVLYEDAMNTGFGQSCRGYFILCYLGYPKVRVLHGGYQAWRAAGLPVSTATVEPVAAAFPASPAGDILVDKAGMLAAVKTGGAALLDVRDVDEWIGASSSPYGPDFCPRKGRIPGARWIEWYRLMKPGRGRARVQVAGRSARRMPHRGHHAGHAGDRLLLQGRAGLQYLSDPEGSRHSRREDLLRILERMVARPGLARRGGISQTR